MVHKQSSKRMGRPQFSRDLLFLEQPPEGMRSGAVG